MDLLRINTPNFLSQLSPPVVEKVKAAGRLVQYQDGQLVHSRGTTLPGISIVADGVAHVGVYGRDGRFVMTAILGAGECFGEFTLFTDLPRTHDVYAGRDTSVYQLTGHSFMQLYAQHAEISQALLTTTLLRSHLLLEMLDAIRRLPLPQRTARILLTMAKTSGQHRNFVCRQEELAYTIGVSRVSIGKALHTLQSLGFVSLGYRYIELLDLDAMRAWLDATCD
ncbi:hypothetical protein GCM10008090_00770 [Arenicella chitinivorans]|uniref:Crp/Fnr family transcriptional regulator n=1 Tax=Arenicella chitinivorans TaxID=1329800 RepID=A0A918VGQ4_9GAMM|nr:Crp/Fnr family transcriptional regulator [Arenicella chitinivorans]GGZ96385.1 hypothetical protein GCM10008090_00770 [Arenicella chitinivorans]